MLSAYGLHAGVLIIVNFSVWLEHYHFGNISVTAKRKPHSGPPVGASR